MNKRIIRARKRRAKDRRAISSYGESARVAIDEMTASEVTTACAALTPRERRRARRRIDKFARQIAKGEQNLETLDRFIAQYRDRQELAPELRDAMDAREQTARLLAQARQSVAKLRAALES